MIQEYGMVSRNFTDLLVVVALTILAAVTIFLPVNNLIGLPLLALPLVFLLPGYSLTAVLFPKSGLGFSETLTFSLGLSLAVDIVGGLIINLTPQGFSAFSWGVFLDSVTLCGCIVAALRRSRHFDLGWSHFNLGLDVGQGVMLGLSIVVAASAILFARDWAAPTSASFTELWAQPASALRQDRVDVGVRNSEAEKTEYKLQVQAGGDLVYESPSIVLSPGETWEKVVTLPISVNVDVQAFLYRMDDPGKIYRQVVLRSDGR
jgi:uncharacterized membrane protein